MEEGLISIAILIVIGICLTIYIYYSYQRQQDQSKDVSDLETSSSRTLTSVKQAGQKLSTDSNTIFEKQRKQKHNINGIGGNIQLLIKDYEIKMQNLRIQDEALSTDMSSHIKKLLQAVSEMNEKNFKSDIQSQLDGINKFKPRLVKLGKDIQLFDAMFKQFRTTMIGHMEAMPLMNERLETVTNQLAQIRAHYNALSDKLAELSPVIATASNVLEKASNLDNRVSSISVEKYDMIKAVVEEYKSLLPILNTLSQDFLASNEYNTFNDRYMEATSMLRRDLQSLNAAADNGTVSDQKALSNLRELKGKTITLQQEVDKIKNDGNTATLLAIDRLEKQIGQANLSAVKDSVPHLRKLAGISNQIGDVDLNAYIDHIPNLSRLPSLIQNIGDTDISAYSGNLKELATLSSLDQNVKNSEQSASALNTMVPTLAASTMSMKNQVETLNQRIASQLSSLNETIPSLTKTSSVTKDGKLIAKNGFCIEDVCIDREKLKDILSKKGLQVKTIA